jgi:hypothetical protein
MMTENLETQCNDLLGLLESYRMDYAETRKDIYIILKDNHIKIAKINGQTNNETYPTIKSLLLEIESW